VLHRVENNSKPEPEAAQRKSAQSRPHHSSTVDVVVVDVNVVVIVGGVVELALVVVSQEYVAYLRLL
jgi:hypothetical protein